MDYYMQRSTYKHDYSKGGIPKGGRSTNYPSNVAPPADINPPAEFYRSPARIDPGDQIARNMERLDFEERTPRIERRRPVKRGEEWVPGRRYENYDEPQTDRGYYRSPERNGYEQERGRNGSPDRVLYDRGRRRDDEQQRYHDRDRVRHTSIDRYYDRDFSPQRSTQRYERPKDLDAFADQGRFSDRTTYKDYGEFMGPRMKDQERMRMTMEQLASNQTAHHDGVFLFIRSNQAGRDKIKNALKRNRTVLGISGGKLKGIAEPGQVLLLEGNQGWNISAPLIRKGDFWAERHDKLHRVDDIILVFRFPHEQDAEAWLRTEPHLKDSNFPEPDRADIFHECERCADEEGYDTFLITEYPKILKREFAHNFAPRILNVIRRKGAIGEDHYTMPHGVKFLRGRWVNPYSIFTCLRFRSGKAAFDFYRDDEMQQILTEMRRYVEIQQRGNPDVFPITIALFTLTGLF